MSEVDEFGEGGQVGGVADDAGFYLFGVLQQLFGRIETLFEGDLDGLGHLSYYRWTLGSIYSVHSMSISHTSWLSTLVSLIVILMPGFFPSIATSIVFT